MRRTIREECEDEYGQPYFIVKIIDSDTDRVIRRSDGSERLADSRYSKDPYAAVEKPTSGAIRYNLKGIV